MDDRLKSLVFNSCKYPVRVFKNGKYMYVPCGHCAPCVLKRSKQLTGRVLEEFKVSRYTLFFTLTYDNAHIPLVSFNEQYSRWIPHYLVPCVPSTSNAPAGTPLGYPEAYMLPKEFGRNAHIPRIHNYHDRSVFGCVCKKDVVLFIKRLRVNLNTMLNQEASERFRVSLSCLLSELGFSRKLTYYQLRKLLNENESFKKSYYALKKEKNDAKRVWRTELFRYFIVSEYGPAHKDKPSYHRPHYHGLLFIEDATILRLLPSAIRKSWTLCDSGNIDVSVVSDQKAAGYVAKYVTGNTTLPAILKTKLTRTFYLSSRRSNSCVLSYSPEKLTEMYERRTAVTTQQRYNRDGTVEFVDVPVPQYVLSRYFPKCTGYGTLSFASKLRVYSRFYAPTSLDEELTRSIYANYQVYPHYAFNPYTGENYCDIPSEFCVSDITAARACARWCKIMKCTPEDYLKILDWFYFKRDMYKLEQQYLLAEEHRNIFYDMSILDDLPRRIDVDCTTLDPLAMSDDIMQLRFSAAGQYVFEITGSDVSAFYDDDGNLDMSLLDEFRESNQRYYADYLNGVDDDIALSNKSKVLNDDILNSVY